MDPINLTATDLATVAGASAAVLVIAQFAKMLFGLEEKGTRTVALVAGVTLVVLAHVALTPALSVLGVVLALIVGMQAGLAAVALFDSGRHGFAYRVSDSPERLAKVGREP